MPPRPRPKPRPKPAPAASSSTSKPQDEDEFFIKHRSDKMWTQLNKLSEKEEKENQSRDSSDEEDEEVSPRKRKKRTKAPDGDYTRPKWERDKSALRILSEGLSDDDSSESGIEIVGESGPSNTQGKRKRQELRARSRSKSLTPPPMLSRERLEAARKIIRQTFDATRRPTSPSQDDDDDDFDADLTTDTIVLDPELAKAAKAAKARAASRASSATPFDGPEDKVTISVTWQPHPKDPQGRSEAFNFEVERHKPLREVFESVADEMGILSSKLYMTHQGVRIFGSVTANYLKVGKAASLVACEKATYEYLREQEEIQRRSSVHPPSDNERDDSDDDILVIHDGSDDDAPGPRPSSPTYTSGSTTRPSSNSAPHTKATTPAPDEDEDDEKFKIILRSSSFPDVPLTVRPTTTCGAIIRAFLKKVGVADQYPNAGIAQPEPLKKGRGRNAAAVKDPHLEIDGDKMAHTAPIDEAGLDDGDVVDVHGL
ncbi:hypothetical protein EV715DRAFT_286863 [Schizophyllum commune]